MMFFGPPSFTRAFAQLYAFRATEKQRFSSLKPAVVYASVLHNAKEGEEELKMLMTHIFDGGVYDSENGVFCASELVKKHGLDKMERHSLECDDFTNAFANVPRANSTLTLLVYHH